jgi:hypothetical protein
VQGDDLYRVKDPADPPKCVPVNFSGDTIRPVYHPDSSGGSGGFKLHIMFPSPARRHP